MIHENMKVKEMIANLDDTDLHCIKELLVHEYKELSNKAARYRTVLSKMGYTVMNGYEYTEEE